MKFKLKLFYTALIIVFFQSIGCTQSEKVDFSGFLKEVVESPDDNFWVRIHAAEALTSNNFTVDVEQLFRNELNGDGAVKIGALRVMAGVYKEDGIKIDSIAKEIFYQFETAENEHTKLVALETLGKLGIYLPDEQITALAHTGKGGIKGMALWVLANSGNPQDINALTKFCLLYTSEAETVYRYDTEASI